MNRPMKINKKQLKAMNISHEYHEIKGAGHGTEEFKDEQHFGKMLAFLQHACPEVNAH